MSEPQSITELDVAGIVPAKSNRSIDKASLKELTESIRAQGVLQPVLVRPMNGHYELVYGERRVRAAKEAGLKVIPAMIRELSDVEAAEMRLTENLQRKDLHPLEEAQGYRELHEEHGYHVNDIAAKVGKSRNYVYGRMKLCALSPKLKGLFSKDEFSASIALLVARIPSKVLQEEAAKKIIKGRWDDEPLTYLEAKDLIEDDFMRRLKEASFDVTDETLVPKAGACSKCPKRTGNQPELFSDLKSEDVCTDPLCFKEKLEAHWKRRKLQAESIGHQVLDAGEAKKAFHGGYLVHNSGLVDLNEKCHEDPQRRTYAKLLAKADVQRVVARDDHGNIHELVATSAAKKALRAAGIKTTRSTATSSAETKRRAKAKLQKDAARAAIEHISEKTLRKDARTDAGFWRTLVLLIDMATGSQPSNRVLARWKLPAGSSWDSSKAAKLRQALIRRFTEGQLRSLALELLLEDRLEYMHAGSGYPYGLKAASEHFDVDLQKLEAQIAAERAEKKAGKKAAKKTRRSSPASSGRHTRKK